MVVKVKKSVEKTRFVKKNDNILREQRNVKYHEWILSNK